MKLETLKPIVIGIDPGKHTGVAIYDRRRNKLLFSGTKTFYQTQLFIVRSFPDRRPKGSNEKATVKVFVEKPGSMLYERNESTITNHEMRIMYYAGGNVREAELMAECLGERGYEVELVPPVHEKKWDQQKFTLFTGSQKRTSEHERDAVRLAIHYANKRPKF